MKIGTKLSALCGILALTGCVSTTTPYVENSASRSVPELTNQLLTIENGQSYGTNGFIEMFRPNYFVLVSAPDGRDLSGDFKGAAMAASLAVRKFDCKRGTQVNEGSKYSAEANRWLIVTDCRGSGRALTGS